VLLFSIILGRYPKPGFVSFEVLLDDQLAKNLILSLRVPRIVSALLLGFSLSLAGLIMQTAFRNPLVDPGFLGVSQGAAFGAALGIILGLTNRLYTQGLAILFAILGLALSFWISRQVKFGGQILRLVLSGIAVSAFFSAGVGILKYLADPVQQLPEIVFWLLGGLWAVKWDDLIFILPIISSVIVVTILLRWRLNVLTLSQEVAFSLGVDKNRETLGMILISVIITALVVSYSGIVSWIGLVIPNISRILIGADTEKTVPVTIMLGGIFALICDDLARTLLAGEIPLSIFTALLGASIFIIIFSIKRESLP